MYIDILFIGKVIQNTGLIYNADMFSKFHPGHKIDDLFHKVIFHKGLFSSYVE